MLVDLSHVTFGYAGVPVAEDVSFSLHENERVGFIGGNGEGKTTLLKLILGELTPEQGAVSVKNGARIGYLEQSGGLESGSTVYGAMEEVFDKDKRLIAALNDLQNKMADADGDEMRVLAAKCESVNKQIAARDSYHCDVKIKTVLNGMGFGNVYGQYVNTMSGGEKTKLKLCRLLLETPDLLILDEPTNHLDVKTLFWLEDYLSSYKGALLVVSHDRYFLDRLTSRTLELEQRKVISYKGNYTRYKQLKAERVLAQQREYEKQCETIAHLKDYVDRNLVRATTAKSAQSRVKQLGRIEPVEKPVPPPRPPRFRFTYDEKPYERVISAEKFDLSADGKMLLCGAEFHLMRGDKCALVGDNGTGKSTLLKYLLSGTPKVKFAKFTKIAYYDQENAELDPDERVLDAFWGKYPLLSQTDARKLLAQSGISAEDTEKKVSELSGGLKAKLSLALLQAEKANVLILDEPTNHLDLPARESLEEALSAFDGTLLFVSHDRRFIQAIANKIVCIENKTLSSYDGGYNGWLEENNKSRSLPEKPEHKRENTGYRSREERAKESQTRARIKEIETRLEGLEAEEERLNLRLAECAADYAKVKEITARLEEIHAESDALYGEYETLI